MQALLAVIVAWLSANYALTPLEEQPRIELVSNVRLTALRNESLASNDTHSTRADSASPAEP